MLVWGWNEWQCVQQRSSNLRPPLADHAEPAASEDLLLVKCCDGHAVLVVPLEFIVRIAVCDSLKASVHCVGLCREL